MNDKLVKFKFQGGKPEIHRKQKYGADVRIPALYVLRIPQTVHYI